MYRLLILIVCLLSTTNMNAQDDKPTLPYHEILPQPDDYSSGNVIARMVDGLGYRYYWATEGLRVLDLAYRPTPEASNTIETLQHLYGLSQTIVNTALNQPNMRPTDFTGMDYGFLRKGTLENLQMASEHFRGKSTADLAKLNLSFQRGETVSDFPVWNLLNGPLADAIYHTGQIVSFRRTSGNPVNGNVNVFMGKNRGQ